MSADITGSRPGTYDGAKALSLASGIPAAEIRDMFAVASEAAKAGRAAGLSGDALKTHIRNALEPKKTPHD